MRTTIKIGDRVVGDGHPVFIIAEAGANHNGDIEQAKRLIDAAKTAGADCVKFQTYTAEEFLASKEKLFTYYSQGKKIVESEFNLLKRLEFNEYQWRSLIEYCKSRDIMFLTTIQNPSNLEMMRSLGIQAIKVGSDDFDHTENLKIYADSGLPLILSKGMADLNEVSEILGMISPMAKGGLAILHCISLYPTEPQYLNLKQIETLKSLYQNIVFGFSDHSQSTLAPALAVFCGAKIIEKHFTLDHSLEGPDHWFSMNPEELTQMINNIRFAELAMGSGLVEVTENEKAVKSIMRRRVLAKDDIPVGAVADHKLVEFKRATEGMFVSEWNKLVIDKQTFKSKVSKGYPIASKDFI